MNAIDADPLIVTAAFDPSTASVFQELRTRHFPPHLNIVPAHLTLFHTLPGQALDGVRDRLQASCEAEAAIAFSVDGLRFLGRGVALVVAAPRLIQMRTELARTWRSCLSAQDSQAFRPHVTIQNKVDPVAARALHARLEAAPMVIRGTIVGLDLWRYRGGPWEPLGRHAFVARTGEDDQSIQDA